MKVTVTFQDCHRDQSNIEAYVTRFLTHRLDEFKDTNTSVDVVFEAGRPFSLVKGKIHDSAQNMFVVIEKAFDIITCLNSFADRVEKLLEKNPVGRSSIAGNRPPLLFQFA